MCRCVCVSGEREGESDRFKGEREENNEDSSHADRPDRVWQVSQRQCPEKQEETTPEDERRKTKKNISLIRSRYTSREALAPPIFQKTKKGNIHIHIPHRRLGSHLAVFARLYLSPSCFHCSRCPFEAVVSCGSSFYAASFVAGQHTADTGFGVSVSKSPPHHHELYYLQHHSTSTSIHDTRKRNGTSPNAPTKRDRVCVCIARV